MKNNKWYFFISIITLIIGYYLLSNKINNEIILPKGSLIYDYLKEIDIYTIIINVSSTILKATVGYLISFILALTLAIIANYKNLYRLLNPYISILKTIPTISIIIIALIWLGKEKAILLIAILLIFPILYEMFYSSIRNVDKKLLEVCKVYQFNFSYKVRYLYFYNILENMFISLKQTFGLCFKVIVMAEVIGQANLGIGAQIQNGRTNSEMNEVFFWTIILILIVLLIDALIENMQKYVLRWK